jgi:hypothetical protein
MHEKIGAWYTLNKLATKDKGPKKIVEMKTFKEKLTDLGLREGAGSKQRRASAPLPPPGGPWSPGKKALLAAGALSLAAGGGAYLYKKHKDKKMAEIGQTKAAFWRGFEKKAGLWDGRMNVTVDVNPDTVRKLQEGPGKALEEFLGTLKKPSTAVKALAAAALLSGTAGFGYHAGKNTADGMAKKIDALAKSEKKKK